MREAIDDLEKLIARRPDAPAAYALLTNGHLAARDPIWAVTTARALSKVAPEDPRGPYLLGLALLAQGKKAEACEQFERARAISPGFVSHWARSLLCPWPADSPMWRSCGSLDKSPSFPSRQRIRSS